MLLLLLLLSTTKKTTSGFSCNFRTRQIPLRLIAPHAGITKNSSGISFVSSKLNNSIVNHHEEITISVSTMEQGYNKQDNQVVVAIPPLLLSCVAHTVALVGGASSIMAVMPLPAYAAATSATTVMPISSALWAYGHYVSIIAIFGCLSVEKTLVKADMTVEDENTVVKLDVIYGVMAALLYVNHVVFVLIIVLSFLLVCDDLVLTNPSSMCCDMLELLVL